MEPFLLKHPSFFHLHEWEKRFPQLVAGFTTKTGGVSQGSFHSLNTGFHVGDQMPDVCANRKIIATKLQMPLSNWVGAKQTHETAIRTISAFDKGLGSESYENAFAQTDGFFTYEKNILLTLCFADCVPIYFVAPKQGAIGALHAGWKGTVGEIASEMVSVFKASGIPLEDIYVAIGPSICSKCYIVDNRVIEFVENLVEDVEEKPYNQISEGQYCLDLKELNRYILLKSGILDKNIAITKYCTCCDADYFYSHRRDRGSTGRMMSYIGWREEAKG